MTRDADDRRDEPPLPAGDFERPLDLAVGAFIQRLDPGAPPSLREAAVLLTQLEGRGHSCLDLRDLFGATDWLADPVPGAAEALHDRVRRITQGCHSVAELVAAWAGRPVLRTLPLQPGADRLVDPPGLRPVPLDGGEAIDALAAPPLVLHGSRLYLRRYWRYERSVASAVQERLMPRADAAVDAPMAQPLPAPSLVRPWLDRLFGAPEPADAFDWQRAACALALRGRITVITGGPGTGKTYTAARLLVLQHALQAQAQAPLRMALAAPTGKAAARLRQSMATALQALEPRLADVLPLAEFRARLGEARTLHRLLGARSGTRQLRHGRDHPLDVDLLLVDEASMVHLEMMASLLDALPPGARLVLLGDKDQLASVEAGAVLGELCGGAEVGGYDATTCDWLLACTAQAVPLAQRALPVQADLFADAPAPASPPAARSGPDPVHRQTAVGPLAGQTVMLRHSRRFAGGIGALAQAVNAGDAKQAGRVLALAQGAAAWLRTPTADQAGATGGMAAELAGLLRVALRGRPVAATNEGPAVQAAGHLGYWQSLRQRPSGATAVGFEDWVRQVLACFDGFRLLTPLRDGPWGVSGLNRLLTQALRPGARPGAGSGAATGDWYEGRPIIVTRNDPDLGVFNGDVGLVIRSPGRGGALRAWFADGPQLRSVAVGRLADVETAYAMTVHKSQGSEFGHVALVLPPEPSPVLTRELLYTGITRARQHFTLLGGNEAVWQAAVARRTRRSSGLAELLTGQTGAP